MTAIGAGVISILIGSALTGGPLGKSKNITTPTLISKVFLYLFINLNNLSIFGGIENF